MSLVGFKAQNHPQQPTKDEIDDRATTPDVFGPLHERFRFTVDVAAAEHNAKLPFFYTRETDGLAHSWAGESVWCNPPYSTIRPWVEKAWREWDCPHRWIDVTGGSLLTQGEHFRACTWCGLEVRDAGWKDGNAQRIVMLLPANRTEQEWWQDLVEPHLRSRRDDFRVEFLPGRIRFTRPGQIRIAPNERPPFGCCLLIWSPDARP